MVPDRRIDELLLNRYLRTANEIDVFDEHLQSLRNLGDDGAIPVLLSVLTDDTEQHEVMWGLVHLVESYGKDRYIPAIVSVLPTMSEDSPEWAEIMVCRILNSNECLQLFRTCFLGQGQPARNEILAFLSRIADGDAETENRIREITAH